MCSVLGNGAATLEPLLVLAASARQRLARQVLDHDVRHSRHASSFSRSVSAGAGSGCSRGRTMGTSTLRSPRSTISPMSMCLLLRIDDLHVGERLLKL